VGQRCLEMRPVSTVQKVGMEIRCLQVYSDLKGAQFET